MILRDKYNNKKKNLFLHVTVIVMLSFSLILSFVLSSSSVNAQETNIGFGNTGDFNLGFGNSGTYNTGGLNSGTGNLSIANSGTYNTGLFNAGNYNTG